MIRRKNSAEKRIERKLMETLLFDAKKEGSVEAVADILKNGGLAAIPTETVYGLAANAFDEKACENIFKAKGRPGDNPLIVHISDMSMLGDIVSEFPEGARLLAEKFWPGPLTMIMKKSEKIPDVTSANLPSVAVRRAQCGGGRHQASGTHDAAQGMNKERQLHTSLLLLGKGGIPVGNERTHTHHLGPEFLHEAHILRQRFRCLSGTSHHHAASGLESNFLQILQTAKTIG